MIVESTRYPQLLVADLGVKFRDGRAEVSDGAILARLRRLGSMGVVVPDEPEPPKRAPKK